jgi:hypothetical protein
MVRTWYGLGTDLVRTWYRGEKKKKNDENENI